jgi:hypothetical protein
LIHEGEGRGAASAAAPPTQPAGWSSCVSTMGQGRRPRRRQTIGVAVLAVVVVLSALPRVLPTASNQPTKAYAPSVFIAVGSAPQNFKLRQVLRQTWVGDCRAHPRCDYRFFTERPVAFAPNVTAGCVAWNVMAWPRSIANLSGAQSSC